MIIEEPDIEIGAGVSSKAISQKIHLRPKTGRGRNNRPDKEDRNSNNQSGGETFGQGPTGGMPQGFPGFPMMPGQPGMFPPGQFPPFMMPPQMQAFFQQQFGGGQGQGQEGFAGGYGEQQGDGGQPK
jgi:protein NRD1